MYSQAGKRNAASSTLPSLGQADKHVKGSKRTDQQRSENESQADSAGDALHAFADILHEPLLDEHVLSQEVITHQLELAGTESYTAGAYSSLMNEGTCATTTHLTIGLQVPRSDGNQGMCVLMVKAGTQLFRATRSL